MQVARNCTLDEFTKVDCTDQIIANIKHVATEIVAPSRSHFEDLEVVKGYDPDNETFADGLTVQIKSSSATAWDIGRYLNEKIVFTEALLDNESHVVTVGFNPSGRKHNKRIFNSRVMREGKWVVEEGLIRP